MRRAGGRGGAVRITAHHGAGGARAADRGRGGGAGGWAAA